MQTINNVDIYIFSNILISGESKLCFFSIMLNMDKILISNSFHFQFKFTAKFTNQLIQSATGMQSFIKHLLLNFGSAGPILTIKLEKNRLKIP